MPNFLQRLIDERLSELADRRTAEYTAKYATRADGSRDATLARHIDREVHRRASMGRELDIYEPIRWTGLSFLLSFAASAGIKATTERAFHRPAIGVLLASTALNSAVQLVRLYPRFEAGLKGGLDTALAMQQFDRRHLPQPERWRERLNMSDPSPHER